MTTVKLKAPKDASHVSFAGRAYEVVRGVVEVPSEAAAHLLAHGYAAFKGETGAKPETADKADK